MAAAIIIGGDNGVYFTDPIANNGTPTRWWAERGLVHWEEQGNGRYGSNTVRQTLERLKGLQDMLKNSRGDKTFKPDVIVAYQNYIDSMIDVCKQAQEQGMPDDVRHARQSAEDWKAKRHSRMVVVPGIHSSF